jgi:branched-chain amino acid transport system ATP-binding protein
VTTSPLLQVDGVAVDYGDLRAVRDVSLHVGAGEIVTIIGPNGAGKTTLMRSIAGLHRPAAGAICLDGSSIHQLPAHQVAARGLILVPEGRRLFSDMTVRENLWLGAYTARARRIRQATLQRVYDIFPILQQRDRQVAGTLSGGQQQMLAIGRALMGVPRLLLLDEPSLGLAPIVVRSMFDVLRQINAEGIGVLLVEQNAHLALELAARGYVMEQGQVVGEGSGHALLEDPRVQRAYLGIGGDDALP